MIERTREFSDVVRLYEENTKGLPAQTSYVGGKHTWDQVFEESKRAQDQYLRDGKGLRQIFRKLGNQGRTWDPWVGLLPDGEYTSILAGGLKLVLHAAACRSDRRKQILESLQNMPKIVYKAQEYRMLYQADLVLEDLTFDLFLVLLAVVDGLIKWLLDKAVWHKVKTTFGANSAETLLNTSIKDMNVKLEEVQERIDILHSRTVVDTNSRVEKMQLMVVDIHEFAKNSSPLATPNKMDVSKPLTLGSDPDKKDREHMKVDGVDAKNGLLEFLHETVRQREWGMKRERKLEMELDRERREKEKLLLELANHSNGTLKSAITRNELLVLLELDPTIAEHDLQLVHRQGSALDLASFNQARWLFQSSLFQDWLKSANPQVLLIDGNMEDHAMDRISPMSHICALLLRTLADTQAVSIHFFCGQHTSWTDRCNGVRGLMRSFIVQLVSLFDFDLVFINKRTYRDQLRSHELDQLCDLFKILLKQVPIDTVLFCVIDGISLFEAGHWGEETDLLVHQLRALIEDEEVNAIFKLIMTSPHTSRRIRYHLHPDNCLTIPRASDGDRQVLTEREVMLQSRRPFQEPEEWLPSADKFDESPADFWHDDEGLEYA